MQPSLPEVYRSIPVPHDASVARKMFAFAGPGYLVAVGYMDPGNWATAIAGGSAFGYLSMGLILEETGRTLTASPLLATALSALKRTLPM